MEVNIQLFHKYILNVFIIYHYKANRKESCVNL